MKYAENDDLYKFINDNKDNNKEFSWTERYEMCLGICSGFKELHDKDIIHRDLKSNNILLDKDNQPKILLEILVGVLLKQLIVAFFQRCPIFILLE